MGSFRLVASPFCCLRTVEGKIHREGLSPQSRSEFQAALATYQSNKQDFQALLTAFLDVLRLDEEYWQNVSEYETAIARLEQITGLSLR